ncbi:MAG TPA: methylmalonyl-CoA mutase family protein [bacterium]|nr:methylmalonyl-CoA mutase family protein [bacterium]
MSSKDSGHTRRNEWEEEVLKPFLSRSAECKEKFETVSGREIPRLSGPEDLADFDYEHDLGYPGAYPYTRGVYPTMYRGRLWTMRQFAGFGTATESNQRFHYLMRQGVTGLSVAFHLPTIMGRDSDSPRSQGEVGKVGVAVDTLADMETLFAGIPLDQVTTSMTINAPASVLLSMYIVAGEKSGVAMDRVGGTIQNDILKEYIAQKSWIFPPRPSLRIITDIMAFCAERVPKWNTISISGYHIREAGSTAVQELAFTIADGIGYVQAGIEAGLDVDRFAPRLSFFFNAHNDFFEEVAKYRAARRMWARIMRDRFQAKKPESWKLRFHTQTAGCSLTAMQAQNNIIRTTIQALAAVMGGTQSLHTNSMDETLALPTQQAVTIALRTQQIIANESGVAANIDPLGGSYYVEKLTNEMEAEAYAYLDKIEALGGIVDAIEKGFPQREIADASYRYQLAVESGGQVVVGVNYHATEDYPPIPTLRIGSEVEAQQVERLRKLRRTRDQAAWATSLTRLENASRGKDNLMPFVLDAVRAYASVGEICDVWRKTFGEYRAVEYF